MYVIALRLFVLSFFRSLLNFGSLEVEGRRGSFPGPPTSEAAGWSRAAFHLGTSPGGFSTMRFAFFRIG